jgi:phosphate butyryltransferase
LDAQSRIANYSFMLTSLSELHVMARGHARKRLVLAAAHDENALEAIVNASGQQIVEGILVGDQQKIEAIASAQGYDLGVFHLIDEPDNDKAAARAVKLVGEGKADILMKGHLPTSSLLRAVLNKEYGLRTGELISHLALFETTAYHKILGLTDAAMNIAPDLQGKVSLIRNATSCLRKLGLEKPRVALLSAVETVNPDMKSSVEASILSKMAERGQINHCILDGPLALDNAISKKSAALKGINSKVAGDADLLVADDIDVANVLYKSLIYFAGASCAAVILGAAVPIVLTSRADSDETKLNSIALAAAL